MRSDTGSVNLFTQRHKASLGPAAILIIGLVAGCAQDDPSSGQPSSPAGVPSKSEVSAFTDYRSADDLISTAVSGGVPCDSYEVETPIAEDILSNAVCVTYDANNPATFSYYYTVTIYEDATAAANWYATFDDASEPLPESQSVTLRGVSWDINCAEHSMCVDLQNVVGGALA